MIREGATARLAGLMLLVVAATLMGGIFTAPLFNPIAPPEDLVGAIRVSGSSLSIHASAALRLTSALGTVVLAAMLFATLKEEDANLATLALSFRLVEAAILCAVAISPVLFVTLRHESSANGIADDTLFLTLGSLLVRASNWGFTVAATSFSIGSALFCYLFYRSESVPKWLAGWGVLASLLLCGALLLRVLNLIESETVATFWLPILFELVLGFWLLIWGAEVRRPTRR